MKSKGCRASNKNEKPNHGDGHFVDVPPFSNPVRTSLIISPSPYWQWLVQRLGRCPNGLGPPRSARRRRRSISIREIASVFARCRQAGGKELRTMVLPL